MMRKPNSLRCLRSPAGLRALALPAALACAQLALLAIGANTARASSATERARGYFDDARAAHTQLQKTPIAKRSIEEYNRLIEQFRRVYLTAPTYGNSTISLMAIGELSEEMARRWSEPKYFQQAIDAYAFILREYPQSQFRFDARLAIARIHRYDLKQLDKALEQYERYVADYPNSVQTKLARQAAAQLRDEIGPAGAAGLAANQPSQIQQTKQGTLSGKPAAEPSPGTLASPAGQAKGSVTPAASASSAPADAGLAAITDIRYWTNPETSRVVIDVGQLAPGQKLKYQAAQLNSPPRLYVDLQDTRTPKPAGGRTLEVNGDLLKRVRLAQFDKRVSRLVLDLGADTDYQISEMANPYRLVIDVKGKVSELEAAIPAAPAATPVAVSVAKPAIAPRPAASASSPAPAPALAKPALPELAVAKPQPTAANISNDMTLSPLPEPAPARAAAPTETATTQPSSALSAVEPQSEKTSAPSASTAVNEKPTASPVALLATNATPAAPTEKTSVPSGTSVVKERSTDRAAAPIRNGMHSLTRALGLKIGRIFIDAGHGGHDTGTIGPTGLTEKEVALDLARRVGALITEKLGSEVVYSRTDDTFIPLESRVAMANKEGADLFLSIHLNSSTAKNATGIETYYLNFTSDPYALKVAARENSGAQETIANLQGIVRKIALQEKLDESKEFAGRMQSSLRKSLAKGMSRKAANQFDRGVKTAPFVVLIGANMPSVLAEVTFLSNPAEEKRLRTPEHRQKLAEALFMGLASYVDSLSGVKIAPRLPAQEPGATPLKKDKGAPARAGAAPRTAEPAKPEKTPVSQPENVAQAY